MSARISPSYQILWLLCHPESASVAHTIADSGDRTRSRTRWKMFDVDVKSFVLALIEHSPHSCICENGTPRAVIAGWLIVVATQNGLPKSVAVIR